MKITSAKPCYPPRFRRACGLLVVGDQAPHAIRLGLTAVGICYSQVFVVHNTAKLNSSRQVAITLCAQLGLCVKQESIQDMLQTAVHALLSSGKSILYFDGDHREKFTSSQGRSHYEDLSRALMGQHGLDVIVTSSDLRGCDVWDMLRISRRTQIVPASDLITRRARLWFGRR